MNTDIKLNIFLDTNILLHYNFFEIDNWQPIFNSKNIRFIFTSTLIRELDKFKIDYSNNKRRKRAIKAINKIDEFTTDNLSSEFKLSNDTSLLIELNEPVDTFFSEFNLDPLIKDDRLLAAALKFRHHSKGKVGILTFDTVMKLKARMLEIDSYSLPESFLLTPELSNEEKKIKLLEKQIDELSQNLPEVDLYWHNNKKEIIVNLKEPSEPFKKAELYEELEKVKESNPHLDSNLKPIEEAEDSNTEYDSIVTLHKSLISSFNPMNIDNKEYNKKLDNFYLGYKKYLIFKYKLENLRNYGFKANLVLQNLGSVPAENIDVNLHFPNGFIVLDKWELENRLSEPSPPDLYPRNPLIDSSLLSSLNLGPSSQNPPNVSGFSINKSKSHDVDLKVRYLKHNRAIELDPLYIVFNSFKSAKSFNIDYKFQIANFPSEVTGSLKVLIKKMPIKFTRM